MSLRTIYNAYIAVLNEQGYTRLAPYVHNSMVHNASNPMSPDQYGQMIVESIRNFPGFRFEIEMLTVEDDESVPKGTGTGTVAARLKLSYVPAGKSGEGEGTIEENKGVAEPGEVDRVVFYEHVFYRFEEGKIRRVWSLVDLPKTNT